MAYYPLFVDLTKKKCLVVGGGAIALRKVIGLLRAEALVTVIADRFLSRFGVLANRIERIGRVFSAEDISRSYTLVIGATDSPDVNKKIAERAHALGILCNIVDTPSLCSFILPAVVRRGNVSIAVSTSGGSPLLAKRITHIISRHIGPEYRELGDFLANVRAMLPAAVPDPQKRRQFWKSLFDLDPAHLLRTAGIGELERKTSALLDRFRGAGEVS